MLIQDLPDDCPKCGWQFNRIRPPRRMQRKAVLLIWVGLLSVIPWAGAILLMYHTSETVVIPRGPVSGIIALLIVSAPAIVLSFIAVNMRKAIDLKCKKCGWTKSFLIDKPTPRTN